jgi:peptide deformylase
MEGKKVEMESTGFFAHVVQHEVDHLDGILFLKYVKDPSELYTAEELE